MNVRLRLSRPADPGVHPAGMMRPVPPAGVLGIRPGRARSVSDGAYTEERDVDPGPGQAPVRDDEHLPLLVRARHIGLSLLTALLQTAWYRRRHEDYLRLTRFFGTL